MFLPVFLVPIILFNAFVSCVPLEGVNVKYVRSKELDFIAALTHADENFPRLRNVFCSGVLISTRHILTNEHCIDHERPDAVVIFMGSSELDTATPYIPCEFHLYHDWIQKPGQPLSIEFDDIAIIQLCEEVSILPADISWKTYNSLEGSRVVMAGWGLVDSNAMSKFMRKAAVQVFDETECYKRTNWRSVARGKYLCTHSDPYILAGDGDSGSPLLDEQNRVVGITSGVFMKLHMPQSALNMHASVTYYKNFIDTILTDYLSVISNEIRSVQSIWASRAFNNRLVGDRFMYNNHEDYVVNHERRSKKIIDKTF